MGKSFVILYIGNSSKIYKINIAILKGIPLKWQRLSHIF
jgi:hypothetical protein